MKDAFQGLCFVILAAILFACIAKAVRRAVPIEESNKTKTVITSPELATIRIAAMRNNINIGSDNWYILLAIRKAENGGPGREFGIMNASADDLDSQAGWCAASIVKSKARWVKAGKPEGFITFMGRRYCPVGADNDPEGLNQNWVGNVTKWYHKLKNGGCYDN